MIRSKKYTVSEKTRSVLRVPNLDESISEKPITLKNDSINDADDDDFEDDTYTPFKRQGNRILQSKQPPNTNFKQFKARKPGKILFSKLLINLVTKLATTEF